MNFTPQRDFMLHILVRFLLITVAVFAQQQRRYLWLKPCDLVGDRTLNCSRAGIHNFRRTIGVMLANIERLKLARQSQNTTQQRYDFNATLARIETLDISRNRLTRFDEFERFPNLTTLILSDNKIDRFNLTDLPVTLERLILDGNPLTTPLSAQGHFTSGTTHNITLYSLSISRTRIHCLAARTFRHFQSLRRLSISHNANLQHLSDNFVRNLPKALTSLDISGNALLTIPSTFGQLTSVVVNVSDNPVRCSCEDEWMLTTEKLAEQVICAEPATLRGRRLSELRIDNLTCSNGTEVSQPSSYRVRASKDEPARIPCLLHHYPLPPPVQWTYRPSREKIVFDIDADPASPDIVYRFSADSCESDDAWRVTPTGHLFIPNIDFAYAERDFLCQASSDVSLTVHVRSRDPPLDPTFLASCGVGLAIGFSFALLVVIIRKIVIAIQLRCDPKRDRIQKVLQSLSNYKTDKKEKFQTLLANLEIYRQHNREKLGNLKDFIGHHLDKLRGNYYIQMSRIRDNCTSRMDTLRDNYRDQVGRMKDYQSSKREQIRENYQQQMNKVRVYGQSQMERLHDRYKLQQTYLIKILETMNFKDCKNVIDVDATDLWTTYDVDGFPDESPLQIAPPIPDRAVFTFDSSEIDSSDDSCFDSDNDFMTARSHVLTSGSERHSSLPEIRFFDAQRDSPRQRELNATDVRVFFGRDDERRESKLRKRRKKKVDAKGEAAPAAAVAPLLVGSETLEHLHNTTMLELQRLQDITELETPRVLTAKRLPSAELLALPLSMAELKRKQQRELKIAKRETKLAKREAKQRNRQSAPPDPRFSPEPGIDDTPIFEEDNTLLNNGDDPVTSLGAEKTRHRSVETQTDFVAKKSTSLNVQEVLIHAE